MQGTPQSASVLTGSWAGAASPRVANMVAARVFPAVRAVFSSDTLKKLNFKAEAEKVVAWDAMMILLLEAEVPEIAASLARSASEQALLTDPIDIATDAAADK